MTCNTLYSDGTGISGHSPTPRRESIESLAKHIRLLVLDVDGVMTDGGLYYDANGLVMKRFHVLDGIGIRLAKTAGIEVAVLSGMDVPCVVRRLEVLGVTEYHGGADNTGRDVFRLCSEYRTDIDIVGSRCLGGQGFFQIVS